MKWRSYEFMTSADEALRRLMQESGQARIVAGGTDLLIQIRETESYEGSLTLLDVSEVDEMKEIRESKEFLYIGAAVTMTEISSSPLVKNKARALAQGAQWLGSPQIRNVATVGGNVVNAQPAGDVSVPLVALGTEAEVVSSEGRRYVPVEALFLGVGESAVDPRQELISHFRVPVREPPNGASAMTRLAKRKAFTLPTLSVAVSAGIDGERKCFRETRIVAAPVGPTPWRARRAEETLQGSGITKENIAKAAALAREDASPRDSLRGGAEYRKDMVGILTRRALMEALHHLNWESNDL